MPLPAIESDEGVSRLLWFCNTYRVIPGLVICKSNVKIPA